MRIKKLSAQYVPIADRIVILIDLDEDMMRMSLTRRMFKLLLTELNQQIKKLVDAEPELPSQKKAKPKKEDIKSAPRVDQKPPSLITGFMFKPKSEDKVSISLRCQDKNNLNLVVGKTFLDSLMSLLKRLSIQAEWDIAPKKPGARKINADYSIDKSKLH